jgi:hypothetical protein
LCNEQVESQTVGCEAIKTHAWRQTAHLRASFLSASSLVSDMGQKHTETKRVPARNMSRAVRALSNIREQFAREFRGVADIFDQGLNLIWIGFLA